MPFRAEPSSASTQPKGDFFNFYFGSWRVYFELFFILFFKVLSALPNGSRWVLGGGVRTHSGSFAVKKGLRGSSFALGLGVILGGFWGCVRGKISRTGRAAGRKSQMFRFFSNIRFFGVVAQAGAMAPVKQGVEKTPKPHFYLPQKHHFGSSCPPAK